VPLARLFAKVRFGPCARQAFAVKFARQANASRNGNRNAARATRAQAERLADKITPAETNCRRAIVQCDAIVMARSGLQCQAPVV